MSMRILGFLLVAFAFALAAQTEDWRAERDVRKRVELGLKVAEHQLDEARKVYRSGDPYQAQAGLEESVDTMLEAYQILVDTGDDMRKQARRYKKIEIDLRGILRKLEDFRMQAEVVDRGPIERAAETVSRMRENMLKAMFEGGKLPPVEKVEP